MSTVTLRISALPAHVRTARLVATAVARRAGVDESALDEIRLAVGEACTRAVELHQRHAPEELVTVLLEDGGRFGATVVDAAPLADQPSGHATLDPVALLASDVGFSGPGPDDGRAAAGFALAVISGLVDDLQVDSDPATGGTRVSMGWPVRAGGMPRGYSAAGGPPA